VNELQKQLGPPRGLFASGKFDQSKRDIPYTVVQAFQTLVQQILSKSAAEVSQWRNLLAAALGTNDQLISNLLPELDLIIGKQPQSRIFRRWTRTIASKSSSDGSSGCLRRRTTLWCYFLMTCNGWIRGLYNCSSISSPSRRSAISY
jgi:predicted ATPase